MSEPKKKTIVLPSTANMVGSYSSVVRVGRSDRDATMIFFQMEDGKPIPVSKVIIPIKTLIELHAVIDRMIKETIDIKDLK